ncbi:hypothetical protein NE237_003385 [Protea cynaroides]|uniref:C3H1-type domain-containing protein n=1 Tax=Protea cynaroides TaxID=273540 RepID=A0A9Q0KGY9_9MAGN|nr:hypothetical protein NE237_003385 [Protea cynaroides]
MCSGSKRKVSPAGFVMEGEKSFLCNRSISILLEASASDDLISFKRAVEEEGCDVDERSFWYGRRFGSKKMGFEERTPLLIAAMFGSMEVLAYIIETGRVDVNSACGTDGVTALHCAVAGGSASSTEVVKRLLDASADTNLVDANGSRPGDLIHLVLKSCNSKRKALEMMLEGIGCAKQGWVSSDEIDKQKEEQQQLQTPQAPIDKDQTEKKEYPIDLSLPDIKNGIYGTDEFRMYTFKVKPCSRAYSHDWTECPFVHPGENARRRDLRKYHYSCVPCPEFRKGSCRLGDACEYAHGVFECWLHPAQYRTRLCKDETGCNRRICFFAHKPEELRPLYASTGSGVPSSGMPSPSSSGPGISSMDMGSMGPLTVGSPSVLMHPTSTSPMSPSAACSSPMGGALWQNQPSLLPPTMQLSGSRLKTALSARDLDLELELLGLEGHHLQQQNQLMDDLSTLSSQPSWPNSLATASSGGRTMDYSRLGVVKPTNLDGMFGSLDHSMLSQLHGLSLNAASSPQLQSSGIQIRQNMNQQLRSSYPSNLPPSPVRTSSFRLDAASAAVMNSRSDAFAKRSQSFIDRSPVSRRAGLTTTAKPMSLTLSDWGSPNGKLDWGVHGEELNKLRKSASFGFRNGSSNNGMVMGAAPMAPTVDEPDLSWLEPLVKDPQSVGVNAFGLDQQQQQYHLDSGGYEMPAPWGEQLFMDQEQIVAY